jgi:hypothetical protein
MNREELEEALDEALADIAPGFKLTVDRKGQVVIQTALFEDEDGEIFSKEEEADVDAGELDIDEDLVPLEDEEADDDD